MSKPTHYTALGLAPTAPPEVIRAAYKALCLLSHPDKTMHLSSQERAAHAANFKTIQAAYDVLSVSSLKAAYDNTLADRVYHVEIKRSRSPSIAASSARNKASTRSSNKAPLKLTTPEEKAALRAKAQQSFESLREQRAERDAREDDADLHSLKHMLRIWTELAEENRADAVMHAHCLIRIHEYHNKIKERERKHEEWLASMALAKRTPSKPATKQKPNTSRTPDALPTTVTKQTRRTAALQKAQTGYQAPTHSSSSRISGAEKRSISEVDTVAKTAVQQETRTILKAEREAARKARIEQKATAVRAEKAKQQARADRKAQQQSQRIDDARAKAGAAPVRAVGAGLRGGEVHAHVHGTKVDPPVGSNAIATCRLLELPWTGQKAKQECSRCGLEHQNFRDWRKCFSTFSAEVETGEDFFFQAA